MSFTNAGSFSKEEEEEVGVKAIEGASKLSRKP